MGWGLLIKIPCLLVVTICNHISATPPNPRPSVKDGTLIELPTERFIRFYMALWHILKICIWLLAVAEISVIAARTWPTLPISKPILAMLLFSGDGSQICLTKTTVLAVLLAVTAMAIRVWCYRTLGKYFTFELAIQKDQILVTTGPYGIVRHPSYTGLMMGLLSFSLLHGTKESWVRASGLMNTTIGRLLTYAFVVGALFFNLLFWKRTGYEDRELQARFGKQWDTWAARVRYSLVPGII